MGARLLSLPGGPPPGPVRVETTPTSIRLRWSCPSGATGYEVYATPTGGTQVKLTTTPIGPQCIQDLAAAVQSPSPPATSQPTYQTSFEHTGLTPNLEFTYLVRSLYQGGGPADADPVVARPRPWPAPTGLSATLLPSRTATLVWNPVNGATGYFALRKLEGEAAFRPLTATPVAGSPYQDNTQLPAGRHEYQVQAVDGTPAVAVAVQVGPWPAPGNFTLELNERRATLVWAAIPGVTSYQVFRQSEGQASFQQVGSTSERWFIEENLGVGQQVYYVKAAGGNPTTQRSVQVGRPVADVRIYRGTTILDLGWWGTSLASDVVILQGGTPNGPFGDVTALFERTTPGMARLRKAITSVTTYYKVRALYLPSVYPPGRLESEPVPVTFPPPPQGPINLVASSPATGGPYVIPFGAFSVKLSWTCDPEAKGYNIMRGPVGGGREYLTGLHEIPFLVLGCSFIDGVFGKEGDAFTYAVIGVYNDQALAESSVTVTLKP